MSLLNKSLLFLIATLALFAAPVAAFTVDGEDNNEYKYEGLLYPGIGMPSIIGSDQVERYATYHFLSETAVPGTPLRIVLYAEEYQVGPPKYGYEEAWTAYVAVIKNDTRVLYRRRITPAAVEKKGSEIIYNAGVIDIDGAVNVFKISSGITGVRLRVEEKSPGSGHYTEGDDYFFTLDKRAGKLKACLTLEETETYHRNGAEGSEEDNTEIYICDTKGDGKAEILTRGRHFIYDDKCNILDVEPADTIDVYNYRPSTGKYLPSGHLKKLPMNAIELKYHEE